MTAQASRKPSLATSRVARLATAAATLALALALTGCDPAGKKQCAWVLEPEPKLDGTADPGYIPVCARNRTTMKEDCRLQATIEFAKKALDRKFRYVDLRVARVGLPRTVTSITYCDGKD